MLNTIVLDFETRSRIDLKAAGVDRYASDLSTDIICCSFVRKDTGESWLWYSKDGLLPDEICQQLSKADEIEAHNARFDQAIYECIAVEYDYGFPVVSADKWVCTSAQCRVNALPSSLDLATRAVNTQYKKDHSGGALIRKLSIPNKVTGEFNEDPELIRQMGSYCLSDSLATVSLSRSMRELTPIDKRDWLINERINDNGVKVDIELALLAQEYAKEEKKDISFKLNVLTGGVVTSPTQTVKALNLIMSRYSHEAGVIVATRKEQKKKGEPDKFTLDKTARTQILALDLEHDGEFLHELVTLIDEGGRSSVSKFKRMDDMAMDGTDRVHGAFVFAGAGQTQRYASRGLQMHNMSRNCFNAEEAENVIARMREGKDISTPDRSTMDTLAMLLRPALIPDTGKVFVVGDWSAIEARVLPWLSKSDGGDAVLDVFRDGRDIYVETAKGMGIDDRFIGKVANLSLGYGGANGAFNAMATNYGLSLDNNEVTSIVDKWRESNQWAVEFWGELEHAALKALKNKNEVFEAGHIKFTFTDRLLGGTLFCILPNNTFIQYPQARLEHDNRGNLGVTAMKASVQPKAGETGDWPRMRLWGGFLAENVSQATSGCLLRELLAALVNDGFNVVGHVHDEAILEVNQNEALDTAEDLQQYMEFTPEWAAGLPLKAVPEIMTRYGK